MPSVIITHSCADRAAGQLGTDRDRARQWLEGVKGRGQVTQELPAPHTGKRSPSGYFLLVRGTLALPLAVSRNGQGELVATGCFFYPEYLDQHGRGDARVDPFRIQGADLLRHVHFSTHAVQRFQQRYNGNPDPDVALRQLREALADDLQAVRQRPSWTRSRNTADLFLVAWDEFCLPTQRHASNGQPFEALTLLHRSGRMFQMQPTELERQCQLDHAVLEQAADVLANEGRLPADGTPLAIMRDMIASQGRLSWTPPRRRRGFSDARFYLHLNRYYLPVAWDKDARRPLRALSMRRTRRSLLRRLMVRMRSSR